MSEIPLSWTSAFSDKTTGIAAVPQCLTAGDVFGDGNSRILVATLDQKLICFDGPRMTHNITIPDMPSSICVHYSSSNQASLPLVAVGAGNSILFFLNLRQFSKFTLPPPFKCKEEREIYEQFSSEENQNQNSYSLEQVQNDLKQLHDEKKYLCTVSLSLIQADLKQKPIYERYEAIAKDVSATDCVTCLASIKYNSVLDDKATRLLVGTESRSLLLLDGKDLKVEKRWEFDAPPTSIKASGYMSGASVIAVVCRDRNIKIITNLSDRPALIRCESLPIDVCVCGGFVYVALMSMCVKIYDIAGKYKETVSFDTHIISLATVEVEQRQLQLCCVASPDGTLTFLNQGKIADVSVFDEGISALYFGKVGREPNNLLTISSHGGLFLRTLSRMAGKEVEEKDNTIIPPIPIPKKNQLFLQQCQIEKQTAKQMYKDWENSLRYLSMLSANTYASILESSVLSPIDTINFTTRVLGMGPSFILQVTATNTGKEPVPYIRIIPHFNNNLYKVEPDFVSMPTLIGGYKYTARFVVQSLDKDGKADIINIVATSSHYAVPLGTSVVQMPVSQFPVQ